MASRQTSEAQLDELLGESIDSAKLRERSTFDRLTEPFSDSLVLFGAGTIGRRTLAGLRKSGIEPLAILDNNPALWNTSIDGLKVLSPQDGASLFADRCAVVVTIWNYQHSFVQTRKQLEALGCRKIVSFISLWWKYPDMFPPHYFLDLPHRILSKAEDMRAAFAVWHDDSSRNEYVAQLRFRLQLDYEGLPDSAGGWQYFRENLFSLSSDEVFVDCGAFDGDTIKDFLDDRKQAFGSIVALEPDPANLEKLQRYVSLLPEGIRSKITVLNLAAGAARHKVRFQATGTPASAVSLEGDVEVDCLPLDEILQGLAPTYLKMDIEGAEPDALTGAAKAIQESRPILAICVYHEPDHLWRIPLLMKALTKDYVFFLRPYRPEGWDLVCYGIPKERYAGSGF